MQQNNIHSKQTASLFRMVMENHVCPYGLKAKDLLERHAYEVEDHWLESKSETESFKQKHEVSTTPQVFIDGERIGGYDALRKHFGQNVLEGGDTTYRPVIAIFAMALLLALGIGWAAFDQLLELATLERFIAISMCLLALQKLQDVESFSTMFLNYDLLAQRWVRYGYIYPYAEGLAGVLMVAGILPLLSAPLALLIGTIGAVSVIKAVYIDKRELKCACVGGNTNVPLGTVSLTENLMMMFMGSWLLIRTLS